MKADWYPKPLQGIARMLVDHSKKFHPQLDLDAARRAVLDNDNSKQLGGEMITSPFDLLSVETLRDRYSLRTGKPVPTDVFVFGKGEPPRPECTKVGGRPYWPADRPWPNTPSGSPYVFLAQFNFADSRDLVSDLPGDVLVMLVEDKKEFVWELEKTRFEWLPLGLPVASHREFDIPTVRSIGFFGVIYRTADYPGATERCEELDFSSWYNVPVLNGTKIAGVPHFIQDGQQAKGRYLCQLGSIQPHPFVRFPWVNLSEELGFEDDGTGIYGENELCMVDMGTVYVFRDESGAVNCSFECY